jgi:hypothetical protein
VRCIDISPKTVGHSKTPVTQRRSPSSGRGMSARIATVGQQK